MRPHHIALLASLLALPFAAVAGSALAADTVSAKNWTRIRDHVLPAKGEMRWREVPWRASLWDAVIDANREEKPILLWAMNGHPLACT